MMYDFEYENEKLRKQINTMADAIQRLVTASRNATGDKATIEAGWSALHAVGETAAYIAMFDRRRNEANKV